MNPRKEERNQKMLEDRRSGMLYREIAKKYGLTKDRARKIVVNQERWNDDKANHD